MDGLGVFLGFIWGVAITSIMFALLGIPATHHEQFKKDCVKMAHGTVDKSAKDICVKNGKILFHE